MLTRRQWMGAAVAAPLIAQPRPRNILFLIADDLGLHTGAYGDRTAVTPHLDQLAAEGTRFTNAFCATASCSPSRSVMLTGLHTHTSGQYGLAHSVHHQSLLPKSKPLPTLLHGAGYKTGVVGKLHVEPPSSFHWDWNESTDGGRNGVAMAAKARKFVESAGSSPWYLHVGFTDPHRAAQGFGNRDYPGITARKFDPAKVPVPSFLPDNAAVREEMADYYESVHRLDQGVGAFVKMLKDAGQYDQTLIVFLSDNGIPFPNSKTTLYDSGTRLPMIVRHPEVAARGVSCDAMVSYTDLVPTFLECAGAKGPDYPLPGRSILPLVGQKTGPGRDEVFFSHQFHEVTMYYPMRGIRTRQFKYIRNLAHPLPFPFASDLWSSKMWQSVRLLGDQARLGQRLVKDYLHRPEEELYDIQTDADEVRNLAASPAHRATLEALRGRVHQWRKATGDPWLILSRHSGEDAQARPPL